MLQGTNCMASFEMISRGDMPVSSTPNIHKMKAEVRIEISVTTRMSATSSCQHAVRRMPLKCERPKSSGKVMTSSSRMRQGCNVTPSDHISIVISMGNAKMSAPANARPTLTRNSRLLGISIWRAPGFAIIEGYPAW